jgi:hypothetical protein
MPFNDYHFVTRWRVVSTSEEVYAVLDEATDLPRWWPSVYLTVKRLPPELERGPGNIYELRTKGWLPYTLRWRMRRTEDNPPHGFSFDAWGDFVGRGEWTLKQDGPTVDVTFDWRLRADKPLIKAMSWLFKRIFSANHRWAMRKGEESLNLELPRRHGKEVAPPPGPTFVRSR